MLFCEWIMSKLFTFGCSLTNPYGWKEVLAELLDYELVDSAMYAASNGMQVRRLHNLIAHGKISEDDIIVWQITGQERCSFSVRMSPNWSKQLNYQEGKFIDYDAEPEDRETLFYYDSPPNYFDGSTHVDVLSNHELIEDASTYYDFNQSVEELLSTIILLNNTYRILVFVGWQGALRESNDNYIKFTQALKVNNVPHMPETMIDWAVSNHQKLDEDGYHPAMITSENWAHHKLYPAIRRLGWL